MMHPELEKARQVYGAKNQILVSIEELNELAAVLAKFPRYEKEDNAVEFLHDKVLDEVADVYTILEHVKAIFNFTQEEIDAQIEKKLTRLRRWLDDSKSMEQTVKDRKV